LNQYLERNNHIGIPGILERILITNFTKTLGMEIGGKRKFVAACIIESTNKLRLEATKTFFKRKSSGLLQSDTNSLYILHL
jgi:hypothetical protein